jgi:hypothetical protein
MPVINEAKRMRQKDYKGAPLSLDLPPLPTLGTLLSHFILFYLNKLSHFKNKKKKNYEFQTSLSNTRKKKRGGREGGRKEEWMDCE